MQNPNYKPRIIDRQVKEFLSAFGAVCIEGPKWCGKSWTSAVHSQSAVYLGDSHQAFTNRLLAENNPSMLLEGETPRLIDEWQEVPSLWDAIRFSVDQRGRKGQFILTGSATPNHKGILHSGAGRIGRLQMRPMSLWESGDSSGEISLNDLVQGCFTPVLCKEVPLRRLVELTIRGGWPGVLDMDLKTAGLLASQYLTAIVADDVFRLDGIKRDTLKMQLLLRSLARNESTTAGNQTLLRDIRTMEREDIDARTIADYLDVLKRLFVTDNTPPFSTVLRSSVRIKKAEKRHFVDPSLACALLRATPESLLADLNTFGFLFEALCERDLRIYAGAIGGELFHYQDYGNNEIDAVIAVPGLGWIAIEIKLGASQIDAAAANLVKIKKQLESADPHTAPKELVVLCGMTNAAYQRKEDGVFVLPITALKP